MTRMVPASNHAVALSALCAALAAGCGGDSANDGRHAPSIEDGDSGPTEDLAPTVDAGGVDDGFRTILTADWSLPPQTEDYMCARVTVEEDLYVNGIDAINPLGTHHTLLTMGAPGKPDGMYPCSAAENGAFSVFGSGVGTDQLSFPEGVALRIAKGTQLLLNLHLFNTSDEELSGTSGERIRTIPEADVEQLAEGILAGTVLLDIPPNQETHTTGYCTMSNDATIFAVAPHMHQIGVHEKVVAERAGAAEEVIHDAPYDFNEQSFHLIEPLDMAKGDRLRIECTHRNTTDETVTFGESSLAEMCFAGLYRYPADGSIFICSDDFKGRIPPGAAALQ